jgi:hypothetical protein
MNTNLKAAIKPTGPLPDFGEMTEDDLRIFAAKHGIEGIRASMPKDDMIARIKEAIAE